MALFCQECAKFVGSALATCRSCGHEHSREHPASEDPPRWRNYAKARPRRRRPPRRRRFVTFN